ncbi:MAG: tetratricopeptide repeat protein, partial [Lachnospiraceae bacterium]|nr:tetratricopeptide repeat protein [Lachnospiraceae bacterium]
DCYEALWEFEKAIECYKKDLEVEPEAKEWISSEIGTLYGYLGEYDKAIEWFNKTPDDEDYYVDMSEICIFQDKLDEALAWLEKKLEKADTPKEKSSAFGELASFYQTYIKDYKKVLSYKKEALTLETNTYNLYNIESDIAELYFLLGDKKQAKIHAEKSFAYFKESNSGTEDDYLNYKEYRPARLATFAWNYIALGETEKGLQMLCDMSNCTKCRQCRHKACFEGPWYEGLYYEAIGEYDKAKECYERGLKIKPHSLALRFALRGIQKLIDTKKKIIVI